eukprot:gene11269-23576_t
MSKPVDEVSLESIIIPPFSDEEFTSCIKDESSTFTTSNVQELIDKYPVMLFSKSYCAFCLELKRTICSMGIEVHVIEVDERPQMKEIISNLKNISKIHTFPQLYVDGKFVGGCTDCKRLEHSGELQIVLAKYMNFVPRTERQADRVKSSKLFYFPETSNSNGAMCAGFLGLVTCVLCVAYYKKWATPWAVLALAIDFFIRIIAGAQVSPIGILATGLSSFFKPRFNPGPPKQFAAFCGFFMACLACGLYLSDQRLGGVVVLGALIFPTGLEGFLDFCLGCWMFGWGIRLGLLNGNVYRSFLNTVEDRKWTYNFMNSTTKQPYAVNDHVLLPGQTVKTPVDLIRKNRYETEYKLQDINPIKNTLVDFFGCPMATAALAYMYKLTDGIYIAPDNVTKVVGWQTIYVSNGIGVASACLFGIIGTLYFLKIIMYPKKVMKMIITVLRISNMLYTYQSDEHINPSIMMAPVGNYVCALAFATFIVNDDGNMRNYPRHINYLFMSRLWFAVASLFAITFFVITFKRAMNDGHHEIRLRPTLWVWMATSSIAGPAFMAVYGSNDLDVGTSVFFHFTWMISMFFFMVNVVGILNGFFTYCQDMSIWIMAFSTCALAIHTIQYYSYLLDTFTYVVTIFTMAIATAITASCMLHTLNSVMDRSLFTPKNKWGPVSFMKLSHEAFRFSVPRMKRVVDAMDVNKVWTVLHFVSEIRPFMVAFDAHSQHEDHVLFPLARKMYPGLNPRMDADHEKVHELLNRVNRAIQMAPSPSIARDDESAGAVSGELASLLNGIKADFPTWCDDVLEHLRDEEQSVTVVIRKNIPLARQREITARCFDITSSEDWHVVLPFVVKNLAVPMWKVRFIRTFIWSMPERAQEIGLMMYRGVDSQLWAFLSEEIPEMIPRGLPGWKRIY